MAAVASIYRALEIGTPPESPWLRYLSAHKISHATLRKKALREVLADVERTGGVAGLTGNPKVLRVFLKQEDARARPSYRSLYALAIAIGAAHLHVTESTLRKRLQLHGEDLHIW